MTQTTPTPTPSSPPSSPKDPFRLDGKVALVTGSGRGIGAGIALALAHRGAKLIINYAHSSAPAEALVSKIKAIGPSSDAIAIKADVSDVGQIAALMSQAVAHFGKLDIVASNSGVVSFGHLKDVTPEEFDRVFSVNTRGQFFVAREAYRHLEVGGRIILTSSNTASVKGVPKHAVYSGSKGAVETFVRCLVCSFSSFFLKFTIHGEEWGKDDVNNWVCQGYRLRRQKDHRQCCRAWGDQNGHVCCCGSRVHPWWGELYRRAG